ncbi:MAG TPA: polyprenol phosphomannose-dependent alpha 1,6 mannosyltransferase MptB [Pilimelia sp.]|nr:polyprenol phosphomannose-dependent alpha 1,6 mannosyltransferase MptB [Pilimelia sp.]
MADLPPRRLARGGPAAVRYGGAVGALLLVAASWLAGALPQAPPLPVTASFWQDPARPAGLAAWLLGVALLAWAWWRGRHLAPGPGWTYRTVALWLAPLLAAAPLGSRDLYSYACQGQLFAAGLDPYAVGPAALPCTWLSAVAPLWRDTAAPYGPVFVAAAGAAASSGTLWVTVLLLRLLAVAGVLLTAWALPRLVADRATAARAGWLVLACPLVAVHLVAGGHNDALMAGLLLAGVALVVRAVRAGGLAAGGAALGAAVAVKASAAVAVPFVLLALAATRTAPPGPAGGGAAGTPPASATAAPPPRTTAAGPGARRWWRAGVVATAAAAVALGAGPATGLHQGWLGALRHTGDTTQWSAPATAVGMTLNHLGALVGARYDAVPATRLLGVAVLAGLLAALAWRTWRGRLPAPEAAGAALAATVLCAPVFYPWYAAWPLALLAAGDRRGGRYWAAGAAAATLLTLPDGTGVPALTKFLAPLVTAALAVAAVRALRWKTPVSDGRITPPRPAVVRRVMWWSGERSGKS